MRDIILASNSPRRYELLKRYYDNIIKLPQNVEECYTSSSPSEIVIELSKKKLGNLPISHFDSVVLASDTIVWHNGVVLGKPKDYNEAYSMLSSLSGVEHEVYSGYAVAYRGKILVGYDVAKVVFKNLTSNDIKSYIDTMSPYDKAGAYGIQDGVLVSECVGDINTVIGLPINMVVKTIEEIENE